MQWRQQPFFQVALPIIVTFILATWYQSGRITDLRDSMCKRLDDFRSDMNARFAAADLPFTAIEHRLDKLEEKVEGLLERSWR